MPQIGSLKFLSFSASVAVNPFKLSLPSPSATLISKQRPLITLASSSYKKGRSSGGGKGAFPQRRRFTMGKENRTEEDMADNQRETIRFNRKRAEGRDGGMKKNLQLKVRKLNPSNTICYVQILGTGMDTQDTSPSVLLFFDKQRIVFNAGEGLQRFCTEHKIKISKIDHMFLTRVCSETAGGLPGLLLTLAGIGEEGMSVNVWGPSDLKYLVDAMRSFIPNAAMVHSHSFGESSQGDSISPTLSNSVSTSTSPIVLIDDEVVKISAILLQPRYPDQSTPGTAESFDSHVANSDSLYSEGKTISFPGSGSPTRKVSLRPGDISVVYACELPEIKGKFDPSKAASLGLKPGPKYRELQLGNSVKSDTQSIMVHPTDVLGPSIPGPVVLLVDCPTAAHLICLLSLQSLNCYYTNANTLEGSKSVNCVIHLSPASVTKMADYRNWMRRFGSAQHIMAGHEMENIAVPILRSSARIMTRLNYVCPHLFPSSGFWKNDQVKNSHMGCKSSSEDSSSLDCIPAENLLKFHLRPYAQLGLDRSLIACLQTPSEIVRELLSEIPEIQNASEDVSKLWRASGEVKSMSSSSDGNGRIMEEPWLKESTCILGTEHHSEVPSCLDKISRKDMEIVLLGTGSSQPSKYRNVSSIYINLFSKGSMLFDCGEGTLGQLKRRFGVKGADDAVKALRLIWISHIHADHHTGLARVLALRCKLLQDLPHDPLLVVGPRPLKRFLDAYSRLEDLDMQFLDCRHTTEDSWNAIADSLQSDQDCCLGKADAKDTDSYGQGGGRQSIINSNIAKFSQMQSYWKQPGSPVDIAVALPILTRLKKVLHDAGMEVMYSVPVVHCPQAFGVVLNAAERKNAVGKVIPGWKLVYSGDTRPCQALVDASHDATVLIHEATFEDGMEDEALAKNHSTTMEAVKIGTSADAYRIILTHFSQRYPKIPVFDETAMSKTCIGFDLMSINLADLHVLPEVLPHLKLLFKNEMALEESEEVLNLATSH